jgi:aryl-alcohol dehydrogenase-like predicted oxidoreductase
VRYVEACGESLSVIGLGTWQFGSKEWGYGPAYAERDALQITARALELGMNLIDTAEIYAFGRSERIVGQALAGRRDQAFLATKILPVLPVAEVVRRRARASAARLGTDRIDLYQLHWPNPAVPLSNTMAGMRSLQAEGLIRQVGVSNYSLGRWQRAEAALGSPVLSNQVNFSLVRPGPARDLVPWAERAGRVVIAYSPVGQGLLSGRYSPGNKPAGMRSRATLFLDENLARAQPLIEAVRDVAKSHGATPAQVALAWVVRRPNTVAIPGASSLAQVEENAAAADIRLTDEEDAHLTEQAERFRPVTGPAAWSLRLRARLAKT